MKIDYNNYIVQMVYDRSELTNIPNLTNPPNPPNPKSDNRPTSIKLPMKDTSNEGIKPLLMNYKDVQKYFGNISPSTIKRQVKSGILPKPIQVGGRRKMFITLEIEKAGKKLISGGK